MVGGSSVLAPLVVEELRRGHEVVAVTRKHDHLSAIESGTGVLRVVVADAQTSKGVATIAAAGPFDAAAIYVPATDDLLLGGLVGHVSGRSVLVATSAVANPDAGAPLPMAMEAIRPRTQDVVVVLGWEGLASQTRWHSPTEISVAVARALDNGEDCVVGRLRPWDQRPRA